MVLIETKHWINSSTLEESLWSYYGNRREGDWGGRGGREGGRGGKREGGMGGGGREGGEG